MTSTYFYKKILKTINLNKKELLLLKKKLKKNNICAGPFVKKGKMCPNTTALSIKLKRKFKDNDVVSKSLKKLGVSKLYLWLFYIIFDIPSMLSKSFFERKLGDLREAVDELIKLKDTGLKERLMVGVVSFNTGRMECFIVVGFCLYFHIY